MDYSKKAIDKWTFRCYISNSGDDVICDWYESLDSAARGDFDATLAMLKNVVPPVRWGRPEYGNLGSSQSEKCRGLGEIRFKTNGVNHRVVGFYGPRRLEFTFLYPFNKSERFDYNKICKESQVRRVAVESNPERSSHECNFPRDQEPSQEIS